MRLTGLILVGTVIGILFLPTTVQAAGKARVGALEARVAELEGQVAALHELLAHFSRSGDEIFITGANVNIVAGSGDTDGPTNGLGNLIVGYNEDSFRHATRTGSHNLVVGPEHTYSSFGGFVVGFKNTVSGLYSSVSGGGRNVASGDGSSVSGGRNNDAGGNWSVVVGGNGNSTSTDAEIAP
jgi:hypothetical protein